MASATSGPTASSSSNNEGGKIALELVVSTVSLEFLFAVSAGCVARGVKSLRDQNEMTMAS